MATDRQMQIDAESAVKCSVHVLCARLLGRRQMFWSVCVPLLTCGGQQCRSTEADQKHKLLSFL